jgi:hypothetical protein
MRTTFGLGAFGPPIRERALNAKAAWRRPEQQILVHRAKASIARRQARKRFLNPAMFGEPPFEILLALYVRPSLSTVPLDVLSSVVGVPASVALRWLQFLVNEGLVLTVNATDDPCETTAALTDKGRIALNEYFRAAGRVV